MNPLEENKRPLYLADIDEFDEHTGVFLISFVGQPAHEVEAIALSRDVEFAEVKLSLNDDKMQMTGPILIPHKRIYRNDGTETGRDVMFSVEKIETIRNKFHLKSGNMKLSNHNHVATDIVNSHMIESWIITDSTHDKATKLGYTLPVGTWMGTYQVTDPTYWRDKVKSGKATGFSIEGFFKWTRTNLHKETEDLTFYKELVQKMIDLGHV